MPACRFFHSYSRTLLFVHTKQNDFPSEPYTREKNQRKKEKRTAYMQAITHMRARAHAASEAICANNGRHKTIWDNAQRKEKWNKFEMK